MAGDKNAMATAISTASSTSGDDTRPATPVSDVLAEGSDDPGPPVNFGVVEDGAITRSGFPMANNIKHLKPLKLKAILTFVYKPEVWAEQQPVLDYIKEDGIVHYVIPIAKNKGGIKTTPDSLAEALLLIMNNKNYPLHVHCNMGKHRTGCVIACLRKIQKWPISEILQEYREFAAEKARELDIQLIRSFDPAMVYQYAKERGRLDEIPRARADSVITADPVDIFELASIVPNHRMAQVEQQGGRERESRESAVDEGEPLRMKSGGMRATPLVVSSAA